MIYGCVQLAIYNFNLILKSIYVNNSDEPFVYKILFDGNKKYSNLKNKLFAKFLRKYVCYILKMCSSENICHLKFHFSKKQIQGISEGAPATERTPLNNNIFNEMTIVIPINV